MQWRTLPHGNGLNFPSKSLTTWEGGTRDWGMTTQSLWQRPMKIPPHSTHWLCKTRRHVSTWIAGSGHLEINIGEASYYFFLNLQLQLSLRYQSLDCRLFVGFILLVFVLRDIGHLLPYILWRRSNDSGSIHRFDHALSYVGQHSSEPLSPFCQFLLWSSFLSLSGNLRIVAKA